MLAKHCFARREREQCSPGWGGVTQAALYIPRRLAIQLLAEAQKAPQGETHGWIGAKDGAPASVWPAAADAQQRLAERGETIWAAYHSHAHGPGPAAPRTLIVTLDTKGVLQLRCWELEDDVCAERVLKIAD